MGAAPQERQLVTSSLIVSMDHMVRGGLTVEACDTAIKGWSVRFLCVLWYLFYSC